LVAGVVAWLTVLPGTVLLDLFFGVSDMEFVVPALSFTILSAFVLLALTIFAGFARDLQRQKSSHRAHPASG
jgi:hypothetical protein